MVTRRDALRSAGAAAALSLWPWGGSLAATGRRPNIMLIVADDLGYADLGAFGGEIRTPNLDRLALAGVRLSNFHTAAGCSPTRAMLLTGVDHHRTGFGTFAEMIQDNQRGHPGYEGRLVDQAVSVAGLLQQAGYRTLMAGKWHLGRDPRADPHVRGFARSFALIGGGGNHFGRRRDGLHGADTEYRADGRPVAELPPDFYSSDDFTSRMIGFIDEDPDPARPFFGYLAFTAPHYPLQAPPEDMARYRGRYDKGWAALRRERIAGLGRQGMSSPGARPDRDQAALQHAWDALSPDDQAIAARKMEVYAAMVDRLDQNVGRLVEALKRSGRYEDTIFVFMSDNGPEGTELEKSDGHQAQGEAILRGADNSLGAIGGPNSFVWYGPGWARASSAPFRLFKHYPSEGGVRTPAFVSSPRIARRGVGDAYVFVTDLAPTFLQWAGAPPQDGGDGRFAYTGVSLQPYLQGRTSHPHGARAGTGWELWGRCGYRIGRWKATLIPAPAGSGRWELYDVLADPSETRDLSGSHPRQLAVLLRAWNRYAARNGVVLPAVPGL